MRGRTLVNLGLLALVVALALIALYEPGLQEPKQPPLTSLDPTQVHSILISRGAQTIELRREGNAWQMVRPERRPANREKVEQLSGIAATPSLSQFPLPADRLEDFGLAPSPILLRLNDLELEFGGNDPLRFRRYVRIGDTLHLIGNGFHHHLLAEAEAFLAEASHP